MKIRFLVPISCCLILASMAAPALAQWQHKLVGPTSLAFSPDGKTLATGNIEEWLAPGDLRLWRVSDGKLLHQTRYVYGVDGVAFSPDGKTLAMTTVVEKSKNPIRLWDVAAWRTRRVLGDDQFLASISYAPDGKRLVVGSNMGENGESDSAYVWNIATKQHRVLPESGDGSMMSWSPQGTILGAFPYGDGTNSLRAWSADGKLLWQKSQPNLNAIAWMTDGRTFLAGLGDRSYNSKSAGALQVRDAKDGRVLFEMKQSTPTICVAVARDCKMWASGDKDGRVRLWSAKTHRVFSTLNLHKEDVREIKFSPDGRSMASTNYNSVRLTRVPPLQ